MAKKQRSKPFKPARYRCFGEQDGVPIKVFYRSLAAVKKLERNPRITGFSYVVLN